MLWLTCWLCFVQTACVRPQRHVSLAHACHCLCLWPAPCPHWKPCPHPHLSLCALTYALVLSIVHTFISVTHALSLTLDLSSSLLTWCPAVLTHVFIIPHYLTLIIHLPSSSLKPTHMFCPGSSVPLISHDLILVCVPVSLTTTRAPHTETRSHTHIHLCFIFVNLVCVSHTTHTPGLNHSSTHSERTHTLA